MVEYPDFNSTLPVTFRLYAYNSLHGTAEQFDYWIVNNIEVYGDAVDLSLTKTARLTANLFDYCFSNNTIYLQHITGKIKVTVYDLLGNILAQKEFAEDGGMPIDFPGNMMIVHFDSKAGNQSVKIIRSL